MSLSTLIVQREIASIREVEEALARQVLYGGDLITNLMEVCRLDEAQLLPIVAESLGLPPAPPGELPRPEPEAQRLVAAEVAVQRNLAPLSVDRYGLTVAVAEPLSADVEQELSFALALPIAQKIAPLVRIKQALSRDYGVPLDRRVQRLLQRMKSEHIHGGSSFPPMRNADMRLGSLAAPRPPSLMPPAPHSKPPAPVRPSIPPGGGARTLVRQTEMPPMRQLRRRRGAITVDVARTELEEATERDTIFDLVFEFARQYFDYTAVFIVHGEIAEGRDAFGDGAPRDRVARIGVPLDLPGILAEAREKKAMLQRIPSDQGLDAVLMSDLGRSGKTTCAVLPIIVRRRVVALLLGDGGDTGIDATTLADVEGIVVLATAAFERLIVRRKLKGSMMPAGMGDSLAPNPKHSMPPPTKLSEVGDQPPPPAVEELAPPIRDLVTEPMSRVSETVREPVVETFLSEAAARMTVTRGKTDQPPPPANVLAVRRPSGRPIPREEPDSKMRMPAVTAPSNLGSAAQQAIQTVSGAPASALPRSRGRRGEAPKLDFGAVPAQSSMFGAEAFGNDDAERKLLAEIHGRSVDFEPITARDEHPPLISPSNVPAPVSSIDEPPPSPKAESPLPQPVAPHRAPPTDISPVAIPAPPPPSVPPASAELITPDDSDVEVSSPYDDERTPIAPPVDMPHDPDETPLAPAVADVFEAPSAKPRSESKPPTPWPSSMGEAAPSPRVPPVPESMGRPMPASEQQISVAAHRPPSSRSDHSRVLPSVIVDVASEYLDLVDRVARGTPSAEGQTPDDAETELLRAGGYAMPAIMARFPGPVTIERERLDDGPLPRVAECGPVLRLVASQRRTALPFVLSHVEDSVVENRFWATYLLTELVYPDVLDPILNRVFDDEPRVRRAARAAARAFAEAHPAPIVERLELVAMDGGETRQRRALAIEALGETREPLAVRALIPLLDDPNEQVAAAVRAALTTIARQDFGPSSQKWQTWWTANKDRHRLEWLIDALMHEQAALRAAASDDLKTITKEYFGYYDDLPKRERERAQSRYREWWNSVGRVRFNRASSSRR
ncbi:MAG: hypothetical protein JWP87_993 [Labilithrix sp.]|nr:hypothetical protein [Labilithrix sp.]